MWIINWKNKVTGETGHSKPLCSKAFADSWASFLNDEYTYVDHWVENCADEHRRACEQSESFGCMICSGPLGEDDHADNMGNVICDDCWNNL